MPLDFPNSPTIGQTFSSGTRKWTWTGEQWSAANIIEVPPSSFRNKVINGDMRIDQRNNGTLVVGSNGAAAFGCDRFFGYTDNVGQSFTVRRLSGDGPADFNNYFRFNTTTGNAFTASDQSSIQHRIEGANAVDLRWGTAAAKTITVSFWVRTSVAGTHLFYINAFRSPIIRMYATTYTVNTANTWEYKTITIPGDTGGGSNFWLGDNKTYFNVIWNMGLSPVWITSNGSNNNWVGVNEINTALSTHVQIGTVTGATFDLTGVQLEKGSTATPFEHRPIGTELILCQRYFEKTRVGGYSKGGHAGASTFSRFAVQKRAIPTISPQPGNPGFWEGGIWAYDGAATNYTALAWGTDTATYNYGQDSTDYARFYVYSHTGHVWSFPVFISAEL